MKQQFKFEFKQARNIFDKTVQKRKCEHWRKTQVQLLESCDNKQPGEFWKTIGKIGVGKERTNEIPMETTLADGSITTSQKKVLDNWKDAFKSLFTNNYDIMEHTDNIDASNTGTFNSDILNEGIPINEVERAVKSLNLNKAMGNDEVPAEAIQSLTCIDYLHKLFCVCFATGKIPKVWSDGIITPVLKNPSADKTDPGNYRGITVTSAVYKAYCSVLNARLVKWCEDNEIVSDSQNGFRRNRSTVDHLSTLTDIIENRKKHKQSTFVCLVDFSKAYDRIERQTLWHKM
ncbi:uncharacterized protein LOC132734571 [Ruditapes philippinarum]|uniref:uncharacterized protein LOC132734571 n=1 Tax=Ruditapes philippinarum TaxID=129788 RepID=UPI00295A7A02|nr:uncharacterized protein LOC132734571 [Ruditapes philippinarum]